MTEQAQHSSVQEGLTPWLVQASRQLNRGCTFLWKSLITLLVTTVATIELSISSTTPFQQTGPARFLLRFLVPICVCFCGLMVLTILSWLGSRRDTAPVISQEEQAHLLGRLKARYQQKLAESKQMLAEPLKKEQPIPLSFASKPNTIKRTADAFFLLPSSPPFVYSTIHEAYEQAQHTLLVLGDRGAGKTTSLAQLAFTIVQQEEVAIQEKNGQYPLLPFLLSFASWTKKSRSFQEWLVEEIAASYSLAPPMARQLVLTKRVLPLLDGLDEVEAPALVACIVAINAYCAANLQPLVVCSQTDAYETVAVHERLALGTEVIVSPLLPEEVERYLARGGRPFVKLQAVLRKNSELGELATTPLMVQVLQLIPVDELTGKGAELERQIWEKYVAFMVTEKGDLRHSPADLTMDRLGWIAHELCQHNQIIFTLERLQPDWVPLHVRALYRLSIRIISGLLFWLLGGLLFGLIAEVAFGLRDSFLFGIIGGLLGGVVGFLLWGQGPTILAKDLTWFWKEGSKGFFTGMVLALLGGSVGGILGGQLGGTMAGLAFGYIKTQLKDRRYVLLSEVYRRSVNSGTVWGLMSALIGGLIEGKINGPLIGIVGGLVSGAIGGLFIGFVSSTMQMPSRIRNWGLRIIGIAFGLAVGLLAGLLLQFLIGRAGLFGSLDSVVRFGSSGALLGGLVSALLVGFSSIPVSSRDHLLPREPYRRSTIVGLFIGLLVGLLVGVLVGLLRGIIVGLLGGLLFGVAFWQLYGLGATIQHMIVRFWLWRTDKLPWDVVSFLEDARRRNLLMRESDGYSFIHGILLNYFADKYSSKDTLDKPGGAQS